jgi:hypothetical protein
MFEWVKIDTTDFTNPQGVATKVKLIWENSRTENFYKVNVLNRDLDLIAFDTLGSELESLKLLGQNATLLTEYDFNMSKLSQIEIPL